LLIFQFFLPAASYSQSKRSDIHTDFVLYQKRVVMENDLRERIIRNTFSGALDSNTEYKFESACGAVAQFLFNSPIVEQGLTKLFAGYDSLSYDTKRALLEAAYAVYPQTYITAVSAILDRETSPKLFSMCAVYLYRSDTSTANSNFLKISMVEKFPGYDTVAILKELENYLNYHTAYQRQKLPDMVQLFVYRQGLGQKTIYSFQRWNRDYPGLAIVQQANGSFVKDAAGRLEVFQQLARSGSDLPYFITDGSTPQGIYRILGEAVAHNHFIGPTPNLQLIMPFEDKWDRYYQSADDSAFTQVAAAEDSLRLYLALLPPAWRNYAPMMEAWNAGKIGRTEIIAHGTTIDPEYFKDKPFYPLTPTMGCLCAKELWNPTSGHLLVSEQFNLMSAYGSTQGNNGYLYVINLDDRQKPVSRQELEEWVRQFEGKKISPGK
jgi:hypothetical protein